MAREIGIEAPPHARGRRQQHNAVTRALGCVYPLRGQWHGIGGGDVEGGHEYLEALKCNIKAW